MLMFPVRKFTCTTALSLVRFHWSAACCSSSIAAMHRVTHHRQVFAFASKLSPTRRPWSIPGAGPLLYPSRLQHAAGRRTMCHAAAATSDDLVPGVFWTLLALFPDSSEQVLGPEHEHYKSTRPLKLCSKPAFAAEEAH